MKKIYWIIALATILSCTKESVLPPLSTNDISQKAKGAIRTDSVVIEQTENQIQSGLVHSNCTSEDINISGTIDYTIQLVLNNEGNYYLRYDISFKNLEATGTTNYYPRGRTRITGILPTNADELLATTETLQHLHSRGGHMLGLSYDVTFSLLKDGSIKASFVEQLSSCR